MPCLPVQLSLTSNLSPCLAYVPRSHCTSCTRHASRSVELHAYARLACQARKEEEVGQVDEQVDVLAQPRAFGQVSAHHSLEDGTRRKAHVAVKLIGELSGRRR